MRISDWSSDVCSSDLRSWWTACRRRWAGQHHWRAISSGKESGLWSGLFNALSGVASVSLIVFPAIDLKGGKVVRLAEGDMDREIGRESGRVGVGPSVSISEVAGQLIQKKE